MSRPRALGDVRARSLARARRPLLLDDARDYGAEVIKIEPLEARSRAAGGPPFYGGESAYFVNLNRNKKASRSI
jgi:hypothetical protein